MKRYNGDYVLYADHLEEVAHVIMLKDGEIEDLTQRVKELEEQRDAFERLVKVTKEVDRDEPK